VTAGSIVHMTDYLMRSRTWTEPSAHHLSCIYTLGCSVRRYSKSYQHMVAICSLGPHFDTCLAALLVSAKGSCSRFADRDRRTPLSYQRPVQLQASSPPHWTRLAVSQPFVIYYYNSIMEQRCNTYFLGSPRDSNWPSTRQYACNCCVCI
jgi:hypothetical protein